MLRRLQNPQHAYICLLRVLFCTNLSCKSDRSLLEGRNGGCYAFASAFVKLLKKCDRTSW
ncbi:MAG TPA: hypothetical protein V6D28_31380 [Leptolyngbyaceae cyanobacterium]